MYMAKTRSSGRSSKKMGGYFGLGSIINTAIVPGSLLALQQSYRKKKHGGKRTRKNKGKKSRKSKRRH